MSYLRRCRIFLIVVLAGMGLPALASAQEQADDQLKLNIGGVYNAWFQNQQNFFLGATDYDDRYIVQMLRLNLSAGYGDYIRAVTRIDLAQGWWGVDNDDYRGEFNANGNPSSRWANKDTNYGVHVDIGYLEFGWPGAPVTARVGRMYYGLGNKIILDSNFDGIQLDIAAGSGKIGLGWAKASEGPPSTSDLEGAEDADLFTATYNNTVANGAFSYGLYGMYYTDRNEVSAFMPQGIDYFRARFTPQISTLGAIGLTATYKNQDLGLTLSGEANYLTGSDDIDNADSGANQLLDINNGDISGYNVYANLSKTLGPKADLGLVFGMGSGDDDYASGAGNINRLKTMGFFYITEVWEESIMPDEEGITPQGLGAPNARGYRELENTTLLQANLTFRPAPKWRTHAAYSYIRSTEPIRGWQADAAGVVTPEDFTDETSQALGSEIDFLIGYKPYSRLDLVLRGGYMMVDDASHLLVNGRTNYDAEDPWELKAMITFTF